MRRDDLSRLAAVTEAASRAEQAKMARLRHRETELQELLRSIEADRKERLSRLDPTAPAARAGAVMTWQGWIDQRKARINAEIAGLRVEMERLRPRLIQAHGRDRALREAGQRLMRKDAALRQRRLDSSRET